MESSEVDAADRAIAAALRSAKNADDPADKVAIVSMMIGLLWTAARDAAAIRRDGVRDAIRSGWSPTGLSRRTGVPQPRVSQVVAELRRDGELPPAPRRGRAARTTRRKR